MCVSVSVSVCVISVKMAGSEVVLVRKHWAMFVLACTKTHGFRERAFAQGWGWLHSAVGEWFEFSAFGGLYKPARRTAVGIYHCSRWS